MEARRSHLGAGLGRRRRAAPSGRAADQQRGGALQRDTRLGDRRAQVMVHRLVDHPRPSPHSRAEAGAQSLSVERPRRRRALRNGHGRRPAGRSSQPCPRSGRCGRSSSSMLLVDVAVEHHDSGTANQRGSGSPWPRRRAIGPVPVSDTRSNSGRWVNTTMAVVGLAFAEVRPRHARAARRPAARPVLRTFIEGDEVHAPCMVERHSAWRRRTPGMPRPLVERRVVLARNEAHVLDVELGDGDLLEALPCARAARARCPRWCG